jgi:hypothetical protein
MPIPDPPDWRDDGANLHRCPSCSAPTWPRVTADGEVVPRRCVDCQIRIDRDNGHDLMTIRTD